MATEQSLAESAGNPSSPHPEVPHGGSSEALPLEVVTQSSRRAPGARRGRRWWIALGLASVLLAGGAVLAPRLSSHAAPPPSASSAAYRTDRVVGLGRVLPLSGVRKIAAPFGAGDARIAVLQVAEGDRVERGALLAILDNEGVLLAAVESARAQIGYRVAARGQVVSSVTASRAELDAQLSRARVAQETAQRELTRTETLFTSGGITAQALDQQRAARDESQYEVDRLRATLSRYGSGSVYAQADSVVAGRNLNVAKAELARATADLEKAYVRAPLAGTVLTLYAKPGERPGANGILSMGDIDRMKVEVDVYQTQIGRTAIGDSATVRAPALQKQLTGVVSQIGLEIGRQDTMDPTPAANTDARVIKVTVALDEASSLAARGLTNLQVTTEIFSRGGT